MANYLVVVLDTLDLQLVPLVRLAQRPTITTHRYIPHSYFGSEPSHKPDS